MLAAADCVHCSFCQCTHACKQLPVLLLALSVSSAMLQVDVAVPGRYCCSREPHVSHNGTCLS